MAIQYFKIKKERYQYLGNRYFKVDYTSEKCLQICMSSGDVGKGRGNSFGVYLVGKLTFFSNYMAQAYVEPCTKKEFDSKFDLVVKMLK